MKKKPVSITRGAHAPHDTPAAAAAAAAAASSGIEQPPASGSWATASVDTPAWIQSVAVCPMSDLVASGAGDGFIRLWGVQPSKHGGAGSLKQVRTMGIPAVRVVTEYVVDGSQDASNKQHVCYIWRRQCTQPCIFCNV
jgi:hypothetical protein